MDFSKLRKLFYIVCIISMLLSIKSKVFGASYSAEYQGVTFTFDDTFNENNPYYCLFVSDGEIYGSYYARLYRSNSPMNVNLTSSRITIYNNNNDGLTSFFGTISSLSNYLQENGFDNNPIPSTGDISDNDTMGTTWTCLFTNHTLYNTDGSIFKNTDIFTAPFFDNVSEIENGNPDGVFITAGDYSENDNLYFHLLQIDTGLSNSDTSIYYYSDKTFLLNKDSDYYRTWYDPNVGSFYYYIPRYKLGLSQNTSYLYVLNNSKNQIQNSYGLYEKDISNGIYDVIQSDTAGVITATEEETDRMKNIEQTLIQNQETNDNINNTLTNTNISEDTETNIEDSLDFNNQNTNLNNLNNGFFSRLTTLLSNLLGYNLADDTSVSLPLPNSNKLIVLHSKIIYDNVTGVLRLIINAFWTYIFSFYMWKFINKIYIAVSTGHILDTFSSSGEAITNDML